MSLSFNLEDFFPAYPEPKQDGLFDRQPLGTINNMLEFKDLKLDPIEPLQDDNIFKQEGTATFKLTKHQQFVQRLMSAFTQFDGLCMVHEMGTGKTCSAIAVIEHNIINNGSDKDHWSFGLQGAIVLTRGRTLMNNFMDELIHKCAGTKYLDSQIRVMRKLISKFYTFYTYETFAKVVRTMTPAQILSKFNHRVVVIDEAHNLRLYNENVKEAVVDRLGLAVNTLNVYKEIHRFVHILTDRKVLLLTGTPMRDGPDEIATLMNLILPLQQQLPIGKNFMDRFYHNGQLNHIDELKQYMYGRVSYLKTMDSSVKREFIGSSIGSLKTFKVYGVDMAPLQEQSYDKAYVMDRKDKGIYSNSRQASLMVFPDGSWGKAGFDKYVVKHRGGHFSLTSSFKTYLHSKVGNKDPYTSTINQIKKLSSSYGSVLELVRNGLANGQKSFIYCDMVHGSGLIVLSLLMEELGFTRNRGFAKVPLSYAIVTNETTSSSELKRVLSTYNDPQNYDGKWLGVVLGSRVVAEGITLKDTIYCFVMAPHWNYSETAQAISRIWRLGSHESYIKHTNTNPIISIYQYVSLSTKQPSIDLSMYEISERKDVTIAQVIRCLKEAAIDCTLFKDRNLRYGYDGLKDCDYAQCTYTCDIRPNDNHNIVNNYNTIYYYTNEPKLILTLERYFKVRFSATFTELINFINTNLPSTPLFQVCEFLRRVVYLNITIRNLYGYPCYVKEDNGTYFLIDNIGLIHCNNHNSSPPYDQVHPSYYTKQPQLYLNPPKTFREFVDDGSDVKVMDICRLTPDSDDLVTTLRALSVSTQQRLLEITLSAKIMDQPGWPLGKPQSIPYFNSQKRLRDLILNHYKQYWYIVTNDGSEWSPGNRFRAAFAWFSNDITTEKAKERCLYYQSITLPNVRKRGPKGKKAKISLPLWYEWGNCKRADKALIDKQRKVNMSRFQTPIGYYGIHNPRNDKFCIRQVKDDDAKDKRKLTTGKLCTTWDRAELAHLASIVLKLKAPSELTIDEAQRILKIHPTLRNDVMAGYDGVVDDDMVKSIAYWGTLQRKHICDTLFKWFKDHNLMDEDNLCGVQAKRKG